MSWFTLNEELLHEAFQDKECADLLALRAHADPVPGICKGLAARIRQAILANGRGGVQGEETDIPMALRPVAVALLRVAVLTRYNLSISEDRRTSAREAEERLRGIEKGEIPFATSAVATRPTYHSRPQRWGRSGSGGMLPSGDFRPRAIR